MFGLLLCGYKCKDMIANNDAAVLLHKKLSASLLLYVMLYFIVYVLLTTLRYSHVPHKQQRGGGERK